MRLVSKAPFSLDMMVGGCDSKNKHKSNYWHGGKGREGSQVGRSRADTLARSPHQQRLETRD